MCCRIGLTLVLYYLGSLAYYVYIRINGMHLGLYNIYRSVPPLLHWISPNASLGHTVKTFIRLICIAHNLKHVAAQTAKTLYIHTGYCPSAFSSPAKGFLFSCSIAMLVVECLGASTVLLYGLNLIWDPLYNEFEDDPKMPGVPKVMYKTACPFNPRSKAVNRKRLHNFFFHGGWRPQVCNAYTKDL